MSRKAIRNVLKVWFGISFAVCALASVSGGGIDAVLATMFVAINAGFVLEATDEER